MRKKQDAAIVVEITIDDRTYPLFEKFARLQNLEQDEALRQVLIRGMRSFQSQQLADMVEDYESLKKQFEDYKRDHDVLTRIFSQNRELAALLNAAKQEKGA